MMGRRAVVGLSLLSVLVFCAFAAQSASAALTTSKNTTAFTCVKDPEKKGDFNKAHCDFGDTVTPGTGEYKHDLIKVGETTTIDGTNNNVTPGPLGEPTAKSEPALLTGELAGAKLEIECTTVKNNTKNSWIRNAEPEKKQHTFEGTIETEFSTCNVKLLKSCTVAEPIVTKAILHGVEGLEGPTKGPKGEVLEPNAMGVEFIGEGPEETFTEIEFKGELCALKNLKFPVKGKAIGTNGPTTESDQSNKETGSTLVFTPKFKMQELKLGPNPAEFHAIATPKMPEGNPISLTTAT
jgi:hypothetical protein